MASIAFFDTIVGGGDSRRRAVANAIVSAKMAASELRDVEDIRTGHVETFRIDRRERWKLQPVNSQVGPKSKSIKNRDGESINTIQLGPKSPSVGKWADALI